MLEEYYGFIDTLREKRFSVKARLARGKILETLTGEKFTPEIRRFLSSINDARCGLIKMSIHPERMLPVDLKALLGGKPAYVLFNGNVYYIDKELTSNELPITGGELSQLEKIFPTTLDILQDASTDLLTKMTSLSGHIHDTGEPFTNFEDEPDQVTQVKKILNAFYHAERALIDAETINSRIGKIKLQELRTLYSHTFHHVYTACYLATHFDINLSEIFSQELDVLAPAYTMVQGFGATYGEETKGFLSQIEYQKLPHKVGVVGGVVIDQLNPQGGDVDYEFLTQFSAVLPGYLDKLSGYIEQFSSTVAEHQPKIDRRELDALQDDALQLLNALDRTKGNSLFLPIKTLQYISIIRHTLTLSTSIIKQAGHLTDTSQDTVRDKLAELKYEVLPALFGLSDKIEENAMLAPGLLSDPLMLGAKRLYKELIKYTSKFVDFPKKGRELITIEDSQFVRARLSHTQKRVTESHQALLKIEETRVGATQFFSILNQPEFRGKRIIDLPAATRAQLTEYYKVICPQLADHNALQNNAIIEGLTGTKGFFDRFTGFYRRVIPSWVRNTVRDTDSISNVLLLQQELEQRLTKMAASHLFHIRLNSNITSNVASQVKFLKLFPYKKSDDPFAINESEILRLEAVALLKKLYQQPRPFTEAQALQIDDVAVKISELKIAAGTSDTIDSLDDLSTTEVSVLYQLYQTRCDQLAQALEAYDKFCQILTAEAHPLPLKDFDKAKKRKLRNLYSVFQPHLVSGLALGLDENIAERLDKDIISALTADASPGKPKPVISRIDIADFLAHDIRIRRCFALAQHHQDSRCVIFANQVKAIQRNAALESALVPEEQKIANRAHHVLKQDHYAKAIADFSQSLQKLTLVFNPSVQSQLVRAQTGLPFPELEDVNQALAQSSQALALKRIFNCLYHIEQAATYLQKLNDQSSETRYSYNVFLIGFHLYKVGELVEQIGVTPSLAVMKGEIWGKLQTSYNALMELRKHYIPEPQEIEGKTVDLTEGHYPALFYTLNTLLVIPEHINAMRSQTDLPQERIETLNQHADKVSADIERIVENSSSYLKLFLEIPTMYRLFRDLKGKLAEMASATHNAVIDNLGAINDDLLTNILLEADRFEDNFGLIPGKLTAQLKEIVDTFYQGLIEPLGLKSQRCIALVSSTSPIEQRIIAAEKRVADAALEQTRIAEKREILQRLSVRIKIYQDYKGSDQSWITTLKTLLIDDFKNALPTIKEVKPLLGVNLPTGAHPVLDPLLNNSVSGEPALCNIGALVAAGASYYQGIDATLQLTLDASKEKITHLHALQVSQVELNQQFIEKYTKKSFEKQVAELSERPVGLIHRRREYNRKLAEFMKESEVEIVSAAKNKEDIDQKVGNLLAIKVKEFERLHYKEYYHLEKVMAAIDRLKHYAHQSGIAIHNNSSVFESVMTLRKKSQLVEELDDLASNEELPVAKRLTGLKRIIKEPLFRTKLLDYHHYEPFTFAWLKQSIVSLIELIGLYTPERNKCYKQLVKSVESPGQNLGLFGTRFNLFSSAPRGYDVPPVQPDSPQIIPPAA